VIGTEKGREAGDLIEIGGVVTIIGVVRGPGKGGEGPLIMVQEVQVILYISLFVYIDIFVYVNIFPFTYKCMDEKLYQYIKYKKLYQYIYSRWWW
jgi:hypothetical protein